MALYRYGESTTPARESAVLRESFPPWPVFYEEETAAAVRVLQSGRVNYWTGEEGRRFEEEFAHSAGAPYAVAVANGTVALELAVHALGVGPGDEVITTPRTFIASASAAVMRGAVPVLAEIDRESQNITAETISRCLSPRTKAIIAVHLAGWPCDMDSILELARDRGLKVIEDCAQAQGATYKGKPVGSLGDAAAFSFCQDKIMTTGGEGGMLVTSDPEVWEKAWSFKDHGKSYQAVYQQSHPPGFRWLHESFGTNWRMTEMQAAIGRIALRRVPGWVETRRRHASCLQRFLHQFAVLRTTEPPAGFGHAYYKYYVFLRPELLRPGWNRDRIMGAIQGRGVPCQSGSCSEIYLEKAFRRFDRDHHLPNARELGETSLMFLVHPTLSDEHLDRTCLAAAEVLEEATR